MHGVERVRNLTGNRRAHPGGQRHLNRPSSADTLARQPSAGEYNSGVDRERLDDIAGTHGILLLVQFGSSVSGHLRADSDIDLAALLERAPATLAEHGRLLADLQSLFPDREVDLVLLNRADPLLLRKITERCELIHGTTRRFQELKIYAFKRYQDHRRYLALEREWVDKTLATLAR